MMNTNRTITRRHALRFSLGFLPFTAWAFGSKDFWDTKPSKDWNAEEVDRMITKSPWAKQANVKFNGGPGGFGGGRGGGSRRTGGGIGLPGGGGIGLPGSGGGYPGGGGGYPGGGGGYPGGGGGYPGGGGGYPGGRGDDYPNGGGGYPGGGGGRPSFDAIVRWESAQPIQEALHIAAYAEKPDPDFEKYHVIKLIGDAPGLNGEGRRGRPRDGGDQDGTANSNADRDAEIERREEMLKQYTFLERKSGPSLHLEKIEQGSRVGSKGPGTLFYFSRSDAVSLDDKEITFKTKMGPMEIQAKFVPKDMLYHGKLAV